MAALNLRKNKPWPLRVAGSIFWATLQTHIQVQRWLSTTHMVPAPNGPNAGDQKKEAEKAQATAIIRERA